MKENPLAKGLRKKKIHMVGIKGVGMTALAEILLARGARISGSDTAEIFFTDAILARLGITVREGFATANVPDETELVIHSAAYSPDEHPELLAARQAGIRCLVYPEALGALSQLSFSAGICGVHGKTTTTAMAGIVARALRLPATVLVGSEVPQFGNRSTYIGGERYLIAETCEYKRHFLHFHPSALVLTGVEEDHQDYFRNVDDIRDAFFEYIERLSERGTVFYCADDRGATAVVEKARLARSDITFIPYGFSAVGKYRILELTTGAGEMRFRLEGFDRDWKLIIPGRHSALNAAAAIALGFHLFEIQNEKTDDDCAARAAKALAGFTGTRRRSEIIGEAAGILFMDDYAHHPTAIRTTIAGLREYYPGRRIVVDFMSHTYSRTHALLDAFAASFSGADEVILHKIYASAREKYDGSVTGETLFDATKKNREAVRYFGEVMDAFDFLKGHLRTGDLFITMGAGDNWKLTHQLFTYFDSQKKQEHAP